MEASVPQSPPNLRAEPPTKILQIGNYPPPMCGWAIQTKLVTEELNRRGVICEILKINENRRLKDPAYIDVQGGWDYVRKVARYAWHGYRFNVHVNGMSKKGYLLGLLGLLAGRAVNRLSFLTFHGGLSQDYFPRPNGSWQYLAFQMLFHMSGHIACDSEEIKRAIEGYGIRHEKICTIPTFSPQYLTFKRVQLGQKVEEFLARHHPVFFSYVSFRAEYKLNLIRECMALYRKHYAGAGFIWLGFPEKEVSKVQEFVQGWEKDEQDSLLLLGNLLHDEFLTLMTRCSACLRTPSCDGVAASVLEALALGIPVIASENGRRPPGVITYQDTDAADMCAKLIYVTQHPSGAGRHILILAEDNVARMADWLMSEEGNAPSGI